MHIEAPFHAPFVAYPSPPSLASSDNSYQLSDDDSIFNMGANGNVHVDGIGNLNYQSAIDIARNSEGELDPSVSAYLEGALSDIWGRITTSPDDYIMTKDEFAVFNFYRSRFDENSVAEQAVARISAFFYDYWTGSGVFVHGCFLDQRFFFLNITPGDRRSRKTNAPKRTVVAPSRTASSLVTCMMTRHTTNNYTYPGRRHKTNHIGVDEILDAAGTSSAVACGDRVDRPPMTGWIRPPRLLSTLMAISMLLLFLASTINPCSAYTLDSTSLSVSHHIRDTGKALLEVFQVYPPVLTVTPEGTLEITDGSSNATINVIPSSSATCQQTLVVYSFGSSYGTPYVGPYSPPACSFNRVTWNLTVVSAGRQFDRLASVSFGDIELFRTSTAEPTANGIEWTYLKDMTSFLPLFKEDQTIIFDLGNIINDIYTAPFNASLTASFFTADDSIVPADLIVPVSKQQGAAGQPSYFTVPSDTASSDLTFPRNVKRAVFTVAATGQSQEEFWWSNVLQSEVDTFPAYGTLYGYSPFREVQLFIDDMLAGVAWPFPIIFTGGVVPGLWIPIVGIDAFDLKEDEIDITPWLPLLCDGNAHNFTIRVSGLNDTGNGTATLSETTDTYWWVSGKVFIWLDEEGHITTGQGPSRVTPDPQLQVSSEIYKTSNGTNGTLLYNVQAQRSLSIASTLNLSNGTTKAVWSQQLAYSNTGNFTDNANVETNTQSTTGYDYSSSGYARKFSYPLYAYSTYAEAGDNLTLSAIITRGKDVQILGQPVFPTGLESFSNAEAVHGNYASFQGASLSTTQNGTATYMANQTASTSYSFGTTEQDMSFAGIRASSDRSQSGFPTITQSEELFHRYALAVNGTVVEDDETLIETSVGHRHAQGSNRGPLLSGFPGRGEFAAAENQKMLG